MQPNTMQQADPMLSLLLHDVLGVLQHLLFPEVKEVGGISVELEGLLAVVPETASGWRSSVRTRS